MTEEHKQKIKEGREKSRAEKMLLGIPLKAKKVKPVLVDGNPILIYTGHEETGFDFWPIIRKILRPMLKYDLCKKIERELVENKIMWKNIDFVKTILEKYFTLQLVGTCLSKKEKKVRKPSTRVLTQAHKDAMLAGRKKKKDVV